MPHVPFTQSNFTLTKLNGLLDQLSDLGLQLLGRGVVNGCTYGLSPNLTLTVSSGHICDGAIEEFDGASIAVPASSVRYVWLKAPNEILLTATMADPGAPWVPAGRVTSSAGAITGVSSEGMVKLAGFDELRKWSVGAALLRAEMDRSRVAVGGALILPVRTITANAPAVDGDHTVVLNTSGGVVTYTLPAAADAPGRVIIVKRAHGTANNGIVAAAGADQIDGAATLTLAAAGQTVRLQSTGTAWISI
ncbi:MAG: hypothetical protein ABFD60_04400 [Bryobacteraceae bacterium]